MGSDHSKSKKPCNFAEYGQIYLQTDKITYEVGETVTGKISLNLFKRFPGKFLQIKFKGKEVVHLVLLQQTGDLLSNVDYRDENRIIDETVKAYSWSEVLPGQYVVPFSFMLPAKLPSSFHQEARRYFADITYKIEAVLEPDVAGGPRPKYKQAIVIRQPIQKLKPNKAGKTVIETNSCGCCSTGTIELNAKFDKTYYSPKETAEILISIDNTKGKIDNECVLLSLKQILQLKAKSQNSNITHTKVRECLTGVNAGEALKEIKVTLPLPPFKGGDATQLDQKGVHKYILTLPTDNLTLNSSTKSKLITSEYYLDISCPMQGCCTTTPAITCPVEIYSSSFTIITPTFPANWQPQGLHQVNLAMPISSRLKNQDSPPEQAFNGTNEAVESEMLKENMIGMQNQA